MMVCDCCSKIGNDIKQTAYGDFLCEDCWDEYIDSDRGKIEYFINILMGEENQDSYDADFLGEAAASWSKYKHLLGISEKLLAEFDEIAFFLGLLNKPVDMYKF